MIDVLCVHDIVEESVRTSTNEFLIKFESFPQRFKKFSFVDFETAWK